MLKQKAIQYILLSILFIIYLLIGYDVQRYETLVLLGSYSVLFVIYSWIILRGKEEQIQFWVYSSLLFRLVLLFAVPALSDDFYRFVWDGRLLTSGHHPFSHIPSFYIENQISIPGIDETLFRKLNSKNYFTIYPPLAQFLFWLSAKLSSSIYGSLMILKISIFLAEVGSILITKKLLDQFNFPQKNILIYALNPLVILELSGNVHLEAIMIFFILLSCYLLVQRKIILAAVAFAASICVKLVPVIFLPAILPLLGWKKATLFYGAVVLVCGVLFLPLWNEEILFGFKNSLGYYFTKFEFNASIYYLVRELGFVFYGYNIIQTAGWLLGLIALILILLVSSSQWLKTNQDKPSTMDHRLWTFLHVMMWSLLIYFLFTTTLHPWYIITLLALSVFTNYRFGVLWTGMIFLSYAGYGAVGFKENLWIVAFEYATVLGYLAYELVWEKDQRLSVS